MDEQSKKLKLWQDIIKQPNWNEFTEKLIAVSGDAEIMSNYEKQFVSQSLSRMTIAHRAVIAYLTIRIYSTALIASFNWDRQHDYWSDLYNKLLEYDH
jgi:hypothetical protein